MASNKSNYYVYAHYDYNLTTMLDFVTADGTVSIGNGLDIAELLNYEDDQGNKNIDNLTALYSAAELRQYGALIQRLKNSSAKQRQQTITVDNQSGIVTDNSQQPTPNDYVSVNKKASGALILNTQGYKDYSAVRELLIDDRSKKLFDKIPREDTKQLFAHFISRVDQETEYKIRLTSSLRTWIEEQVLINSGQAKGVVIDNEFGKTNIFVDHISYHVAGLALDINLIKKSRYRDTSNPQYLRSNNSKQEWVDSKVPAIAKSLGLRWGGEFSDFDAVHIDAANYYTVDNNGFIAAVRAANDTASEDNAVSTNDIYGELPLHIGTVLCIPLAKVDRFSLPGFSTQAIDMSDFNSFLARELFFLLRDPKFERLYTPQKDVSIGEVLQAFPHATVWVWSRGSSLQLDGSYKHKIYNITPYINSVSTNVTENGGSFQLSLPGITAEINGDNEWVIKQGTQKHKKSNTEKKDNDYVSLNFVHYQKDNELKRNKMLVEKVFQQNDIVFIRFEKLVIEESRESEDGVEFIPIDKLPNNIFDMIGLVDNVSITTNAATADINLSLQGRDLVKLLIEDGVYFYPAEFIGDGIFANTIRESNDRLGRFDGQIMQRFQLLARNVDKSLKYVMNALSSIDICPTDLFTGYKNGIDTFTGTEFDKRSKTYRLNNEELTAIQDTKADIDKDTYNVKVKIQKVRKKNGILGDGTPTTVFNTIATFLRERYKNKEVIESPTGEIVEWYQTIDKIRVRNLMPDNLLDTLFIRKREWVDKQDRPFTYDNSMLSVTNDIDDLFDQAGGKEAVNKRIFPLFSQLGRTLVEDQRKNISNQSYPLEDILSELEVYTRPLKAKTVSDGVLLQTELTRLFNVYSSDGFSYPDQITSIKERYKVLIDNYKKYIKLSILNSEFNDLESDEKAVFNDIFNIVKREQELNKNASDIALEPASGIWQIIKLVVDDSVKNRLIADASIGNEHGSLLNAIRKICQSPFCEFFTDTYGDQFYFIARKKPFDQESLLSTLAGRLTYERLEPDGGNSQNQIKPQTTIQGGKFGETANGKNFWDATGVQPKPQGIVIDIEERDVINDTLTFTKEAYSWYRLQLKTQLPGNDSALEFAYLKAVFFNEYADIFGSKPLDIPINYIPYMPVLDKNQQVSSAYLVQQGIYDLKYLIESHAYLPFTRQGSITINGDRRIKRGTFVRLKSTNEIFYVDAVSNSFNIGNTSIDRNTTLQLSRGMVENYIKGNTMDINGKLVNVSYFNIIDTTIDQSVFSGKLTNNTYNDLILSKWKVNPEVFNFFVKRMQFDDGMNNIKLKRAPVSSAIEGSVSNSSINVG